MHLCICSEIPVRRRHDDISLSKSNIIGTKTSVHFTEVSAMYSLLPHDFAPRLTLPRHSSSDFYICIDFTIVVIHC